MLLFVSLALADDSALAACCKAGGASVCPKEILVRTEHSSADTIGIGWEVVGAWRQSCSGKGKFDATLETDTDSEPEFGEILTTELTPLAAHCFAQACSLPADVCISSANTAGKFSFVGCSDNLPADQKALSSATKKGPAPGARIVVLDGKPLVATSVSLTPPPQPVVAAPAWETGSAPTWQATDSTWTTGPSTPTSATTYTPAPPAAVPTSATTPPPALALPADPPDPCAPAPDAVRSESRRRVGTGDDLRIVGRAEDALSDYRAALTMDKCNGYAWMSIAQLASDQARTDLSIRALRNATRLLPAHPGAFLMLGKALEAFGQTRSAADAYKRATELSPSNAEAIEGYMRTRG